MLTEIAITVFNNKKISFPIICLRLFEVFWELLFDNPNKKRCSLHPENDYTVFH